MPWTGWQPKEKCAECGHDSVLAECDRCKKKLCLPCVNVRILSVEGEQFECDACLAQREHLEDHKEPGT